MPGGRNPWLRASDADRDRVADTLQRHCAEGRLSVEEFRERLEALYAARTLGDLDRLIADLPAEDPYQLPVPAKARSEPARRAPRRYVPVRRVGNLPVAWGTWAAVNVALAVVWIVAGIAGGNVGDPWWLWITGVWGAILAGWTINDRYFRD